MIAAMVVGQVECGTQRLPARPRQPHHSRL